MEIGVIHTPGGGRLVQSFTSGADVPVDLSALIGTYVTLETDQSIRYAMVPGTGAWSIDPTGAVAIAAATGRAAGAIPGTPYAPADKGPLPTFLVSATFPRLLVRAQGTSATYLAIVQTSLQKLEPSIAP